MTYNYFNELKNSFKKCAYVYSDGYDDGGRSDRALADAASSGMEGALAAATGATADVGRVADTVEETGGAVQKSLDELTPAATGALDALKWAPVALAGIPTAGYLLHQYLRGNYDDKKKKEKEAAYLGKRAMQKEGGYLSEVFGNLPIAGSLAGAGIGALTGDGENALLGGLTGAHLHNLVNLTGAAGSLATPTRDAEDQRKADATGLLNFVPGVSSYNLAKRLGYSIRNPELTEGKANKSFPGGKKDKKDKEEEKEAAYLGKRAMEKAGQRWISKAFAPSKWIGESAAANPIRGRILPALGAGGVGYGTYEATDSPFIGGAAAYGTYGLLSPRAIAKMKASARGAAAIEGNWPKGMTPDEAFNKGLTKMTPDELTSAGMNDQVMKAIGRKGGLMAIVGAGEYAGPLLSEAKGTLKGWRGAGENVEAQSAVPDNYEVTSVGDPDWSANITKNRLAMARREAGLSGDTEAALTQSAEQADQDWLAGDVGQYLVKQYKKPETERDFRLKRQDSTSATLREAVNRAEEGFGAAAETADVMETAAQPFVDTVSGLGQSIGQTAESGKGMTDEMAEIRKSIQRGATKAAPVGAGALGGYILSQLLGPGVKKDETPSERERRERLQRIYNLLGMTGGGGLGYYLANRFGGGDAGAGAGANTKTGGDVKSFKTIARLGRASA